MEINGYFWKKRNLKKLHLLFLNVSSSHICFNNQLIFILINNSDRIQSGRSIVYEISLLS